ncbi:MAG: SGNH/GDSL hydrolase family protein [Microcella sp.]|uniref:SGNH/GDSL hydrolase family protein n=1 Tax=Microcella sp. TaxID=1913979 RepID=UPI0024CC4961|nr:SGNH/GDSL hydrolase family protein [Microcella sp.]UYN82935.1 MAG: SGNH/GDSL hydrolase family protein [Microcella sp.]
MSDVRPPRSLRLSRAIAAAQAPVLLAQGRQLRRDTPRLPDAPLPWSGTVEPSVPDVEGRASRPLHLLVIGDSTAAGVGVDHADLGLGGRLAEALARRTARPVHWRAAGRNGATAGDLVKHFAAPALDEPTDLVFLTVGANDALALRSTRAFRRDVRRLIELTFSEHPQAALLMSSLPAFFRFTLLPDPLKRSLYRHSQALESEARTLVDAHPRAHMSPPPPPYTDGFFASDDFHPSALGYQDWAEFAVDDAFSVGFDRLLGDA